MTDPRSKHTVLAALSHCPDFFGLASLPAVDTKRGQALLQWLDRSGLALAFYHRLLECNAAQELPEAWRHALCQRHARNVVRTGDMLEEAQRIISAFASARVVAASLKGFTLTPDFCPDPTLRHQVDFDFLVAPAGVRPAAEALRSCGYTTPFVNESGETCFRTPLRHIPSANDDLYAVQRHRQVDVHISIWEPCDWLPVETPQDSLEFAQRRNVSGVKFLSLSLEDRFLFQVLHAFRHSFRSWIRLCWVLEIANCIENHRNDEALWGRVIRRAGSTRLTKSIFAFVLGLVAHLFRTPIPPNLCSWTSESVTLSLRTWLDHFAFDWATSDWPGSLNNLFLTGEFIPDPALRRQYWRSRLLPGKTQTSLGSVATASPGKFIRWQAARLSYVAHRAGKHLKGIAALPRQQLRWRRALSSARKWGFDLNC